MRAQFFNSAGVSGVVIGAQETKYRCRISGAPCFLTVAYSVTLVRIGSCPLVVEEIASCYCEVCCAIVNSRLIA